MTGVATPTMHVKVYSPFRVYFDGAAVSLSAKNQVGPFDVLPEHENFISILPACELIVRYSGGEHKQHILKGVLHVKSDQVIVFLDV